MKNILVTGAAGFIGANFAELMVKKYEGKYHIIVFDKLTYAVKLHLYKEIFVILILYWQHIKNMI